MKYGKGDLFLPIIGRLIEIAKVHGDCSLAFFSPLGLFCGRDRYMKLLNALLKDFEFLKGYVFVGNYFHDINKVKPVALSIWKLSPDANTNLTDLNLDFIGKGGEGEVKTKRVAFKHMDLLMDGWRYDRRDKDGPTGEIVVQHCETFNAPAPKVFHLNPKQGGSEVIPRNVIKPLGIAGLPDELVYALWSISVGAKTFGTSLSVALYPIYFDNAYVHLPDFSKRGTIEILAYAALYSLVENYARERIGFFGNNRVFKFGNERLTKGVQHLIDTHKSCPVYDGNSIGEVFELIREGKIDATKLRKGIRGEVSKRLAEIGYWNYVPIPKTGHEPVAVPRRAAGLLIQHRLRTGS